MYVKNIYNVYCTLVLLILFLNLRIIENPIIMFTIFINYDFYSFLSIFKLEKSFDRILYTKQFFYGVIS